MGLVRVAVLGPVVVDAAGGPLGRRDRVVLVALVLHLGETVSGERLADALWRDQVPPTWTKVVQGCVVRLRKALGPEAIETHALGYRLTIPPDEVDLRRFERLLGRARELLALDQAERAMAAADEALALWSGRPFVDVEDWEPAQLESHRLEELRLEAEDLRLDAALRSGRHREVLPAALAGVESSPTRERRWELLALAQYRAGHQGEALATIRRARSVLVRELGLDTGPDLATLEHAILRRDRSLTAPAVAARTSASCPWPGLLAYGVGDAEEFFGRDGETASCLRRLDADGVVVVVGASGSGKSSLVRAGIAASLVRNGRSAVVVTPGGQRPRESLAALPVGGPSTVVVVDQVEEAVTTFEDPDERRAFFDALVNHATHSPLVMALRADHLGDVSAHDGLARLVERGLFLLGPMSEVDLKAAVEGPAHRAGLLLEPGLVDLVVRDVLDEPGALPLMSHALRQTWIRREGRTLTVSAHRQTGGIRGAVALSAEQVYADLDPDQRRRLRDLLLRLVSSGDSGEPARARVSRAVLFGHPGYEPLIERLVSARLLTSDQEVVELAHEALARAWPRLRDWLDEDVDGLRVQRHLTTAASEWDALGRPSSELYRGVRLTRATAWQARAHPELTSVEQAFLDASVDQEAADLQVAVTQVARERRTVRRLRRLVAGVAVLALLAVVAFSLALDQRNRANDEARVGEARRVSASALVATPHDRALLLAVEAVRLWDSSETRGNLLTTIARSPSAARIIRSRGSRLLDLELAPDGRRVAAADSAGAVTLYDLASGGAQTVLSRSQVRFESPAFSPDGRSLAVAWSAADCRYSPECTHGVEVFAADELTSAPLSYSGLGGQPADIAWSPDGTMLAASTRFVYAESGPNIALWRVGDPGTPLRRLTLTQRGIDLSASPDTRARSWISFSPDGSLLLASGVGPTVALDVSSGAARRTFEGMGSLALSPDGRTLAIATTTTSVALVDVTTGRRLDLDGHTGIVTAAAFSPDGTRLATASNDETVGVWDTASGERLNALRGHAGSVFDVSFGSDGSTLYSAAADRSLMTWDLGGSSGLARTLSGPVLDAQEEAVVLMSPAADSVAHIGRRALLHDLRDGRIVELPLAPNEAAWAAYSPDGRSLVTVDWKGATALFRTADAQLRATQNGRGHDNYGAVAFTADGKGVLVADSDGTVVELSGNTLEPTGRALEVGLGAAGIRTGAGDSFAVTGSPPDRAPGTEIVFGDLGDGRLVQRVRTDSEGLRVNFSPDGDHYAFGGLDGRLGVVDVDTGEVAGAHDPVHTGPIAWVTFSPDGSTLAAMGFDGELTLADAATGIVHARVQPGGANRRGTVGYHPDGRTALLGYQDGSVIAYQTDPQAWIAHACALAGRDLTADEWRDAFGGQPHRKTCSAAT